MDFISINGNAFHYVREGLSDGPPLVCVNSLGTDLRMWNGLVPYFAGQYQIIRYDKRGHGLSDAPPGPYTLGDHTADLVQLLDHLGLDTVVLMGDSVGGMIALDFALRHPERVQALIACDTAAKIGTVEYWNERITAVRRQGIGPLAETILSRWFSPAFASQQSAAYRGYYNMLTRTPQEGYAATCEAIRDADLRNEVGQIMMPVLVLCGAEDGATPPELVRGLAEALPNGRFALIAHAGHLPSIEQPATMAAIIDEFLQEIGYV
jgi:3-oxoadipate enol-lactonase